MQCDCVADKAKSFKKNVIATTVSLSTQALTTHVLQLLFRDHDLWILAHCTQQWRTPVGQFCLMCYPLDQNLHRHDLPFFLLWANRCHLNQSSRTERQGIKFHLPIFVCIQHSSESMYCMYAYNHRHTNFEQIHNLQIKVWDLLSQRYLWLEDRQIKPVLNVWFPKYTNSCNK